MGIKLIDRLRKIINNRPVINHYNTTYSKNALIIYVVEPFKIKEISSRHSNQTECISIAKILSSLGYNIDIYNHDYSFPVQTKKYDVVFGMGMLFERLVKNRSLNCLYIYYGTGSAFYFQNIEELKRINEIAKLKSVYLAPKRFIKNPKFYALTYSDALIVIGNEVTKKSYDLVSLPIHMISQSVIKNEITITRQVNEAKKNFLWFGSHGALHKGLDLCLDSFESTPELQLHVCGYLDPDFMRLYIDKLNLANVHVYGFVDIKSELFTQLMNTCLFSLLPSCSEGEAGALLNTMLQGLIPVTTHQSGIDVLNYGYVVDNTTSKHSLHKAIQRAISTSDNKLISQSDSCIHYIKKYFSIDNYEYNLKSILIKILGSSDG